MKHLSQTKRTINFSNMFESKKQKNRQFFRPIKKFDPNRIHTFKKNYIFPKLANNPRKTMKGEGK